MGLGIAWMGRRSVRGAAAAVLVLAAIWIHVAGRSAPGERSARGLTADTRLLVRVASVNEALAWAAAHRTVVPGLDQSLVAARDALGYDLLDPDTWEGLAVDLDAPLVVSLASARPLAGILVVSIPLVSGVQGLKGLDLLFARISPPEARPRQEIDLGYGGIGVGHVRLHGRLVAVLVEMDAQVLLALPQGEGDVEAGLDGWLQRIADHDRDRLLAEEGVRDALRAHRDAPLLVLSRGDDLDAPPCVQTSDDADAVVIELLSRLTAGPTRF